MNIEKCVFSRESAIERSLTWTSFAKRMKKIDLSLNHSKVLFEMYRAKPESSSLSIHKSIDSLYYFSFAKSKDFSFNIIFG